MKSRLKVVSILLLCALVLSLVPAAMLPGRASAQTNCDRAQFVADVTVPDGTVFAPGATFTKTWRLKNVGTCTWTKSYSLVFDSGEKMGAPDSVPLPSDVPPGGSIDLTVNMTAPGTAGHYFGYWKLKNASGVLFGIGLNANRTFWVEINVSGTTQANVVYDFTASASSATWSSSAGGLPSPGPDGDPRGFWITGSDFKYEDGTAPGASILVAPPQNITNGYIQGVYPDFKVQKGDVFKTQVGCELQATSCYVQFSLAYQIGTGPATTIWRFNEKWDRRTRPRDFTYPDISLDRLAGQDVKFILYMSSYGSPVGDRAIWGNPVIVRKGAAPPPTVTGTPPTSTPTNTPGPVTVTVPPSSCDRAQFVADVTVPDGTVFAPGATFTKTWRLKNVGSCPWTTSYQLVFFSGEQMGAPSSAAFPKNVAIGETVDISVNMTAPTTPGTHLGYWMFKNASGALFG
ncbi:MAG TPA: NBR1-Ig-like domain-containing protein, partial [Anaerolineales bacterium]